jgi:TPR repeat protein
MQKRPVCPQNHRVFAWMIKKESARFSRLPLAMLLLLPAACAPGGPYVLDTRESLVAADYHARQGDPGAALSALEQAAARAPDAEQRLLALRRIPAFDGQKADPALSSRIAAALEEAALSGDRNSLSKLAALQHEQNLRPANLQRLLPFYEQLARAESDKAALLLARLALSQDISGGETAALEWWRVAAERGSGEAQRRLMIAHAIRREDDAAEKWASMAYSLPPAEASLRLARGFLEGDKEFPADPALGFRWASRAAGGGGEKASGFAAGLARRLYLGSDGHARDSAAAERLLAALPAGQAQKRDAVRLSAASALARGQGVRRDLAAALALIDRSAETSRAEASKLAAGLAMRLATGQDGMPRDPAMARRFLALVSEPDARSVVAAALEGRTHGNGGGNGFDQLMVQAQAALRKKDTAGAAAMLRRMTAINPPRAITAAKQLIAASSATSLSTAPIEAELAILADKGDSAAMLALADIETARAAFDPGRRDAARQWLKRAAESGRADAQFRHGLDLGEGTYGPVDREAARVMLLKAKASGNPMAAAAIDRLGLP